MAAFEWTFGVQPTGLTVLFIGMTPWLNPGSRARIAGGVGRRAVKTFELLSIIGSIVAVGVALGAVVIGSNANLRTELRSEMHGLRTELRSEMHGLRTEIRADIRALDSRFSALESRLSTLEQRLARAEGLLEGLRDALASRDMPSPGAQGEAS